MTWSLTADAGGVCLNPGTLCEAGAADWRRLSLRQAPRTRSADAEREFSRQSDLRYVRKLRLALGQNQTHNRPFRVGPDSRSAISTANPNPKSSAPGLSPVVNSSSSSRHSAHRRRTAARAPPCRSQAPRSRHPPSASAPPPGPHRRYRNRPVILMRKGDPSPHPRRPVACHITILAPQPLPGGVPANLPSRRVASRPEGQASMTVTGPAVRSRKAVMLAAAGYRAPLGGLVYLTACRRATSASSRAATASARPPAGSVPRWRLPLPRWHERRGHQQGG